ncbi:MAG: hypothetical protein HRT47_06565 [Candidatus Caenarcaniphilales bacterium]|nr:hypothetical protein [Candidatus Caenarcaniphilales bacterium]
MDRKKKEKHKIHLRDSLIEDCETYLKEYPEAKKFVFLSNDHLKNKLSIRDYIEILLESYDLSNIQKWQSSKYFNNDLERKANEFIEFTKLSSKIYELEEVEKLNISTVYSIFFENLNFYRDHNIFFNQFRQIINEYIEGNCQGEVAHRVIGRCTQQWLSSSEYNEELVSKFKEFRLSLSTNFKKIMNENIRKLSVDEKEYIRAKCLDEIFKDKIICSLFNEGYLPEVSLDKIQVNGHRKIKSMASQIEDSRYFYTSLQSINSNEFMPNTWF